MRIVDLMLSPLWLLGCGLTLWVLASLRGPVPRALRYGAVLLWLCAWMLSAPLTANLLLHALESRARQESRACAAPAPGALFIVLAGGLHKSPEGPGDVEALSAASLRRGIAAVALARRTPRSRLLFSGGVGHRWREADLMAELAVRLGFDAGRIERERDSRTTLENARDVARMLGRAPGAGLYLVTSAYHMPRAYMTFRRVGLPVCALPVDFQADLRVRPSSLLPDLASLHMMSLALHEYLGELDYRWWKLR